MSQEKDLEAVLRCDTEGCSRQRSAPPLLVQWNLMAPAALMSDSSMRLTINLSHVISGVDPTWNDNGTIERSTSMTFKIPKPVMTQTEMPGEPNAEQWRPLLSALDTGHLRSVAKDLNIGLSERMHRKRRNDDGHRVAETPRQYMVDMCCRQDAAKVRAAIVALIPPTHPLEQRLTTGHSALLENGTSHFQQPTDSPDATSGEDDSSCPAAQRRRADRSGDTSATASVGDSSNACVPRDSADSRQPHPSTSAECVAEPYNHNSRTQMVRCVTQTRTELTACCIGDGPPVSLASFIPRTIIPSLHDQVSQLALMEPVPDAVFKHVDKPIILCISKMLSSTGAMLFFVNLGLSHDQYTKTTKKRDDIEEAYFECFILLGRCVDTEINVEKLIEALKTIYRNDIVEEVRKIQKTTVATVSTCE
ncbi:uncharacterized protein [Littorina saxatilis]|uniref:uncharacterized protein n=1 Tax=Littorina saxatilis TaxID=31220 RepID=UPI0038B6A519